LLAAEIGVLLEHGRKHCKRPSCYEAFNTKVQVLREQGLQHKKHTRTSTARDQAASEIATLSLPTKGAKKAPPKQHGTTITINEQTFTPEDVQVLHTTLSAMLEPPRTDHQADEAPKPLTEKQQVRSLKAQVAALEKKAVKCSELLTAAGLDELKGKGKKRKLAEWSTIATARDQLKGVDTILKLAQAVCMGRLTKGTVTLQVPLSPRVACLMCVAAVHSQLRKERNVHEDVKLEIPQECGKHV
jgi:hypothetical protein